MYLKTRVYAIIYNNHQIMTFSVKDDNLKHLGRFKNEPPCPAYIAGLIDGDGCIFIRKIKNGYQSGITLTQCRTNILQIIRYHFGGSITSTTNRNDKTIDQCDASGNFLHKFNRRNQFNLLLRSNEYKLLLDFIRFSIILKQPQLECLYEFYKFVDIKNVDEEKETLFNKCTELNKIKNMDDINNYTRMSIGYIQGLFDAEGCFYIDKNNSTNKFKISITQKSYPKILEKIKEFLGFGNICTHKYVIYNKLDCLKFIALIKDGLIVKYNQLVAFETYLLTDNKELKIEMYKICNEEKHKIECFADINCNTNGKESYNETMRIRGLKDAICREIKRKESYKEKSKKMLGEGNHNYGKVKSTELRKKLSTAIRNAKNGISDEMILNVRTLINEGKPNYEIQELLGLSRDIVSRIKNGRLVCRTENPLKKTALTKEEWSVKKRKIKLAEICSVIEKTVAGETPASILHTLVKAREEKTITNHLTIDIIKNIKRSLLQNKIPFYKNEVGDEMYQHYCTLLADYNTKE